MTLDQERDLGALVRGFEERRSLLLNREGTLCKAALLRAIAGNQVESMVAAPHPGVADPAAANRHFRDQAEHTKQGIAQLAARFGKPLVDWGYSQIGTIEPDGIPRQNIVYFTRAAEPQVFEVREGRSKVGKEKDRALRDFFARL